ncbi:MAG: 4-oxalocrotonate tautomerase [Limnochordia bacterium]|jgi:4-oxalocrotonate tautomerase|nr:4-oxalocrotonate tautomerase [Bacillota bacterium]
MPIINVAILEGRTLEQKRKLVEEVTKVVCDVLGCGEDAVTITIEELAKENLAKGGKLFLDR